MTQDNPIPPAENKWRTALAFLGRGLLYLVIYLLCCLLCVIIGSYIVDLGTRHGDAHPSVASDSAEGLMMFAFIPGEIAIGLALGFFVSEAVSRRLAQRRALSQPPAPQEADNAPPPPRQQNR